jgi:hypothetical protein
MREYAITGMNPGSCHERKQESSDYRNPALPSFGIAGHSVPGVFTKQPRIRSKRDGKHRLKSGVSGFVKYCVYAEFIGYARMFFEIGSAD